MVRLVFLSVLLTPVSSLSSKANPVGAGKPAVLITKGCKAKSGLTLPARSIRRTARLLYTPSASLVAGVTASSIAALAKSRKLTDCRIMTVPPFSSSISSPSCTPSGNRKVSLGSASLVMARPCASTNSKPPAVMILAWLGKNGLSKLTVISSGSAGLRESPTRRLKPLSVCIALMLYSPTPTITSAAKSPVVALATTCANKVVPLAR